MYCPSCKKFKNQDVPMVKVGNHLECRLCPYKHYDLTDPPVSTHITGNQPE